MIPSGPDLVGMAWALNRHPRGRRAALTAFQDARLRRLLVHAYERVPFYRKLFDRHRVHPRHVRGAMDLALLPTITKQQLRGRPASETVARDLDPAALRAVGTNGSAGESLVVRRTTAEQAIHTMFRYRCYRAFGLDLRGRIATVGYPGRSDPSNTKLAGRVLDALGVHPTLHLDGLMEPELLANQLETFRPELISALPSMLARVGDYILAHRPRRITPRAVVVDGEVLTSLQRRRLMEAFGVEPLQTYASHEFPLLGWECRATGLMHICDDGVILEVLKDGRAVEPGEEGEVVVTSLHAYAMPLIRYRLADLVSRGTEGCPCGQPFSVIGAIRGRTIESAPLEPVALHA